MSRMAKQADWPSDMGEYVCAPYGRATRFTRLRLKGRWNTISSDAEPFIGSQINRVTFFRDTCNNRPTVCVGFSRFHRSRSVIPFALLRVSTAVSG
jgi:hypothetical protein